MLVLSRRAGESIRIGEDIEVHLLEVRGDTVRVGIQAPKSVKVWRNELFEAVAMENKAAAKVTPLDLRDLFKKQDDGRW